MLSASWDARSAMKLWHWEGWQPFRESPPPGREPNKKTLVISMFLYLVFLKFAGTDFCTAGSCPVPQIGCIGEVFGSVDFPRNTSDVQWPASAGREMLAQKRERQTWNILMHFNFLEVTDIVSVDPIKSFLFSESICNTIDNLFNLLWNWDTQQPGSSTKEITRAMAEFTGLDVGTFRPKVDALSELRLLKQSLDFRNRELQDSRKRLRHTQGRLANACDDFKAQRAGLQAELRALGESGKQLEESLAAQKALLERQSETLTHERMNVDLLRDEVQRMREEQRKMPVQEGAPTNLRAARPGEHLWGWAFSRCWVSPKGNVEKEKFHPSPDWFEALQFCWNMVTIRFFEWLELLRGERPWQKPNLRVARIAKS